MKSASVSWIIFACTCHGFDAIATPEFLAIILEDHVAFKYQ